MTSQSKSRIKIALLAIGAAIMLALPLLLMGCGKTQKQNNDELTKRVADEVLKRLSEQAQSTPSPRPALTPDPNIIANISPETQLREGIKLQSDADGTTLLRVYRKDNEPVSKGLTAENMAVECYQNPIVTNIGDGKWEIVFKERTQEEGKPEPTPKL